ncbi:MAG: UDP-N-acetylmuramate dehydrogenase [Acidiferrobacter sp.]
MMTRLEPGLPVRTNELLARHTTWRVGGPADRFYIPETPFALAALLREDTQMPVTWLGLGSNVLVRDGGIRGLVVTTAGGLGGLVRDKDGVRVGAGVPVAKVARFCAGHGLGGLEFFAGIPGTVGGALAMNAGAAGGETWDHVEQVETIDRMGVIRTRGRDEFVVAYRQVQAPPGEWFVAACFKLAPAAADGRLRIRELLTHRNASQPLQTANAGSVFRNPPGDYAARLIEQARLKGLQEGAAVVSARHANFIVNEGGASAQEIEALIARVQATVYERTGVLLEPEVRIVGEVL